MHSILGWQSKGEGHFKSWFSRSCLFVTGLSLLLSLFVLLMTFIAFTVADFDLLFVVFMVLNGALQLCKVYTFEIFFFTFHFL